MNHDRGCGKETNSMNAFPARKQLRRIPQMQHDKLTAFPAASARLSRRSIMPGCAAVSTPSLPLNPMGRECVPFRERTNNVKSANICDISYYQPAITGSLSVYFPRFTLSLTRIFMIGSLASFSPDAHTCALDPQLQCIEENWEMRISCSLLQKYEQ